MQKNNLLRILFTTALFWWALLVSPAASLAAEVFSDKPQDALEVYVAAGMSIPFKWEWDQSSKDSSNPYLPAEGNLPMKDSPFLCSARVGLIFPNLVFPSLERVLAVEWEYNYIKTGFKTEDKAPSKVTGVSFARNDKFSGSFLFANLIIRYPKGAFHPYLGAGVGSAQIKKETGAFFYSDDSSGTAFAIQAVSEQSYTAHPYQLFVGADYDITPEWAVGLRYKYIKTSLNDPALDADLTFQGAICEVKYTW